MARAPHPALLEWRTVIDVAFTHRQGSFSLDVNMHLAIETDASLVEPLPAPL